MRGQALDFLRVLDLSAVTIAGPAHTHAFLRFGFVCAGAGTGLHTMHDDIDATISKKSGTANSILDICNQGAWGRIHHHHRRRHHHPDLDPVDVFRPASPAWRSPPPKFCAHWNLEHHIHSQCQTRPNQHKPTGIDGNTNMHHPRCMKTVEYE